MLDRIADGRTDLVFDYVSAGHAANSKDRNGVSLIELCGYYGDVSAIRFLLINGESLRSLGEDLGLNAAAFHGHWRLCQFLIEQGADVNRSLPDTGETPLHAALCTGRRTAYDLVVKVLLAHGANPNCVTRASGDERLHARLQNEGRDAPPSCGCFRNRRDYSTSSGCGRGNRCQGYEWRFAARLGELAPPPRFRSQKAVLR
jgi:hypothetical protein